MQIRNSFDWCEQILTQLPHMDVSHQDHLARIMARRRERGVSAQASPSSGMGGTWPSQPQPVPSVTRSSPMPPASPTAMSQSRPLKSLPMEYAPYTQPIQPQPMMTHQSQRTIFPLSEGTAAHDGGSLQRATSLQPHMRSVEVDDTVSVASGRQPNNVTREMLIPSSQQLLKMYTLPPPPPPSNDPVHFRTDLASNVYILTQGDWFIKWSADRNHCHHRFFWLNKDGFMLLWSKAGPNAAAFFSGNIRLEDVTKITSEQQVEDAPGEMGVRILYIFSISTRKKVLQIGTEKRDKFEMWFHTLARITNVDRGAEVSQQYGRGRPPPVAAMYSRAAGFVTCTDPSE